MYVVFLVDVLGLLASVAPLRSNKHGCIWSNRETVETLVACCSGKVRSLRGELVLPVLHDT